MKKYISIICIFSILSILFMIFLPSKKYYNDDFGIENYISLIDKDQDGIDDQTDILNNVKEYIKTKPKYKSKYYATGYPSDEYGVCTDVVAFGLLGAGYDIMTLLNDDVKANRNLYDIDKIDKKLILEEF